MAQNGKNAKVEKPQSRAAPLSCPALFFLSWATVGINPGIPVIYMVLKAVSPTKAPVGARSSPKTLETGVSIRKCIITTAILFFCWIYQIEVGKEVINM